MVVMEQMETEEGMEVLLVAMVVKGEMERLVKMEAMEVTEVHLVEKEEMAEKEGMVRPAKVVGLGEVVETVVMEAAVGQ